MEALTKNNSKQQELSLPLPIQDCIDIAYRSMKGELIGIEDVASYTGKSVVEAIKIITHPLFNQMVHHLSIANAKHSFDAVAYNQLMAIARFSNDEKNKIAAIKALGDMLGFNESKKTKQSPTVNINIDQIVRERKETPFKGF
jgi:hypothetical protein